MGIRGWSSIFLLSLAFGLLMPCAAQDLPQQPLRYVQWSPFPEVISAKTLDEIVLLSPDLKELDRWRIVEPEEEPILAYSWSPDGARLAVMLYSGWVKLWDVTTRQEIAYLRGSDTSFMEWSSNSEYLLLASRSNRLDATLWFVNGTSGVLEYVWGKSISAIAWHPINLQLVVVNLDSNNIELWDITTFPPQQVAQLPSAYGGSDIVFNSTGDRIAFVAYDKNAVGNQLTIYDTQTLQPTQILTTSNTISRLSWGKYPLTSYQGNLVNIWDEVTGTIKVTITDYSPVIGDLADLPSWNPSGTLFVVNDSIAGITVRNGQTGEILASLPPDAPLITSTASPIPMLTPTTR
jgi:WD40 repeat protein